MTWIGRSAGESSAMVSGTRPPAIVGCVVTPNTSCTRTDTRRPLGRRSRSAPGGPSAASTSAGPARRARRRAATAASSAAGPRGRGGRGRPARSRRRGTAPATRRASPAAPRRTRPATRRRAPTAGTPPGPAAAVVAGVHGSTASRVARTRSTSAAVVAGPGAGRADRLAEAQRVEPPLHPLDEVVALGVPLQPAVLDDARRAAPAISDASTAAARRMRAPDRLPSRSAATTNGTVASGSSSATHAPLPLRSWNWPGRRRPARRSGNPTSSAAPASSGSTASASKRTPARRAMSAARSRTRSTARRSARSSRTCPHTERDPQREVGGQPIAAAAQDVALLDDRGHHARQAVGPAGDHAGQPGVDGEPDHRPPERRDGACRRRAHRARAAARRPAATACAAAGRRTPAAPAGVPHAASSRRQPGEVDLGDLGGPMGRAGAVLHPAPQPVGGAGLGAPGPAGALIGRVAADRHGRQPGHPGPGIEAGRAGQPAVDDDPHAVDGQRRLGDVGRQHDAPPTRRRRRQRLVLLLQGERAGQPVHVDVGTERRAARRPG